MKPIIIDGNIIAAKIIESVRNKLQDFSSRESPILASVSVGKVPSVTSYIKTQQIICQRAGIIHKNIELPPDITRHNLIETIHHLNEDNNITAIIINVPFESARIDEREILRQISPYKDVEGLHPVHLGNLFSQSHKRYTIFPPTPLAVMECIKSVVPNLKGKEVVIIGHSDIVGKPLAVMFLASEHTAPTVTVCHIATRNLLNHTRRADVLVTAIGRAGFITKDMVKEGVVVIDVGINRIEVMDDRGRKIINPTTGLPQTRIVGDVNFEEVAEVAYAITPVPGGVGPVTSAMLARNTLNLFLMKKNR